MLRETTRIIAICDDCRDVAGDAHGDVRYFEDAAHAFALVIAGDGLDGLGAWVPVAEVGLLCARCYAARICAEQGHDWSAWSGCACVEGYRVGDHLGMCLGRIRSCRVCRNIEINHPQDGGNRR